MSCACVVSCCVSALRPRFCITRFDCSVSLRTPQLMLLVLQHGTAESNIYSDCMSSTIHVVLNLSVERRLTLNKQTSHSTRTGGSFHREHFHHLLLASSGDVRSPKVEAEDPHIYSFGCLHTVLYASAAYMCTQATANVVKSSNDADALSAAYCCSAHTKACSTTKSFDVSSLP